MVCIRQAQVEDLLQMQRCNLLCLPENYQLKVRAGHPVAQLASAAIAQRVTAATPLASPAAAACRLPPPLGAALRLPIRPCFLAGTAVLLLPRAVLAPAAVRG